MIIIIIYAVLAVSSVVLLHYFLNLSTVYEFPYLWEMETENKTWRTYGLQ